MAKRVRTTGIPQDQAKPGETIQRLRVYRGWQCKSCPLDEVCDEENVVGGPWDILEADSHLATKCLVHPTVIMVPVRVRRIKEARAVPVAPVQPRQDSWHVLLDANALIEGAKRTFPGMIELILEPPPGFHYYVTKSVAEECRFLKNYDRETIFSHIQVLDDPATVDPEILATHGDGITPPSKADAGLMQLARDDPRFTILVSHDRFIRWTGLARTLGINDRLKVYGVSDFVKYAKRKR